MDSIKGKRENNGNFNFEDNYLQNIIFINPLTSLGEVVTVFTYLYLSAGAPAFGEAKGLIVL